METGGIDRSGQFALDRQWLTFQLAREQFRGQRRPYHAAGGKPQQDVQSGLAWQTVQRGGLAGECIHVGQRADQRQVLGAYHRH